MQNFTRRLRRFSFPLLAGVCAFSLLSPGAHAAPAKPKLAAKAPASTKAPGEKSVESVLKESGLAASKNGNFYRVYIEGEGQTTGVTVTGASINDSPNLRMVYLFTNVLEIPKGTKVPAPLLKRMAQINNDMFIGKLSLQEGDDGSNIYYNSALWLKTATGDTLRTEIELAHYIRLQFAKELAPFLKEE